MFNQIFLVSGATNGIGFYTAQEIAKKNKTVIIIGKNFSKGQSSIKEIKKNTGNNDVHYINGDLSSQGEIKKIANLIKKKFSKIDVFINNVGVIYTKRTEMSLGETPLILEACEIVSGFIFISFSFASALIDLIFE